MDKYSKENRYQYQKWYIKLWRQRYYFRIPFKAYQAWKAGIRPWSVAWSVARGLTQGSMNWVKDWKEIKKECKWIDE